MLCFGYAEICGGDIGFGNEKWGCESVFEWLFGVCGWAS